MELTLVEQLLTDMLEQSQQTGERLKNWGTPMHGTGPRPRKRVQVHFDAEKEPSKTEQSFRDECNINLIMAKYRKSGEMSHLARVNPTYGDFSLGLDFQTAQNHVIDAQADFDSLSAEIRARMNNDPGQLLDFLADPENLEEARELGLAKPKKVEPGVPALPPKPKDPTPKGDAASGGDPPPVPPKPKGENPTV